MVENLSFNGLGLSYAVMQAILLGQSELIMLMMWKDSLRVRLKIGISSVATTSDVLNNASYY